MKTLTKSLLAVILLTVLTACQEYNDHTPKATADTAKDFLDSNEFESFQNLLIGTAGQEFSALNTVEELQKYLAPFKNIEMEAAVLMKEESLSDIDARRKWSMNLLDQNQVVLQLRFVCLSHYGWNLKVPTNIDSEPFVAGATPADVPRVLTSHRQWNTVCKIDSISK